ncbi:MULTISPECIES: hypothetical protein [Streptomyces]|nr:hypothetical protein [Streptomyces katrae]
MLSRSHRRPVALDPADPLGATLYAFAGAALFEAARFAAEHVSVTVTLF